MSTPTSGDGPGAGSRGGRVRPRLHPGRLPDAGRGAVRRWRDYRERQLLELAESNRIRREQWVQEALLARELDRTAPGTDTGAPPRSLVSLASPFYVGFVGALGVISAWWLAQNVGRLSTVISFVLVAFFLTLVLNPLVEVLTRRAVPRWVAVTLVFLGLLGVTLTFAFTVLPPIVQETATLVERTPRYLTDLADQPWVAELDERYRISERVTEEIALWLSDSGVVSTIFGGVMGAAGWLAGGAIYGFTAPFLTLYFLASLPTVKDAAYRLVPASRRPRVATLAEEIMRRVGGYALGQVLVATINGTLTWVLLSLLGLPYPMVLAVMVGLLGLIPVVGATLGAAVVALVAFVQDPALAAVVIVYYVAYQQIENYLIVPRVMARTVSVPAAVTIVAVLAGGTLLGVLGALLAIPVAAGLLLIYKEVVVPRQERL